METLLHPFLESLFRHHFNCVDGTFFLATDSNRSAQVVLNQGELVGINFGDLPASEALSNLLLQQSLRHSFSVDLKYPVTHPLSAAEGKILLERFGYREYRANRQAEKAAALAEQATIHAKTRQLMYRGQKILQEAPQRQSATSARVYRGQTITAD